MAPASRNLLLGAVVSLFVHVPFEIVAKVSLIAAAVLFVVDPLPPYSRLIAIVSCWIVLKLTTYHRNHEDELHLAAAAAAAAAAATNSDRNDERGNEEKEKDEIMHDTKKDM